MRSAEKAVSPLSWFTRLSCAEVAGNLHEYFMRTFDTRESAPAKDELDAASRLVESKYATPAWISRLP